MASEAGTAAAHISQEAHRYSLLQLVRWIKATHPNHQLRLRSSLKRGLAYLEVEKAWLEGETWYLEVNWPGLYGSSSPVPAYITEQLLAQLEEAEQPARALLDLLNERLYEVLLVCLSRNYPAIRHLEWQDQRWMEQLFSLLGIQPDQLEFLPEPAWLLEHYQLLTSHQRSASGLTRLLQAWLPDCQLHLEQCCERSVAVDRASLTCLAKGNHQLGQSAWVGSRLRDNAGRIRLHLGPVSHAYFCQLLADQKHWKTLQVLIQLYLQVPVECRLVFYLDPPEELQNLGLGLANWGHLGKNTWVMQKTANLPTSYLQAELPLVDPNTNMQEGLA